MLSASQRRYLPRWLRSLHPDYLLRTHTPWLVFPAIDMLEGLDLHGKRVFEYGSGGSTLFWLRKGCQVVAVEHDPAWFARVQSLLPPAAPIDYRLVEPELGAVPAVLPDPANPDHYVSASDYRGGRVYRRYAMQIDQFAEQSFDIVLIDGRARPACLKHSVSRVKLGGYLILDNSDRPYYTAQIWPLLRDFACVRLAGPIPGMPVFSETSVYQRTR